MWKFPTGITIGKDFKIFAKLFKEEIEKQLKEINGKLLKFTCGYYFLSGFCKRNNKIVYFAISDPRFSKEWYYKILIRKARAVDDFIGEKNHYVSLKEFGKKVKELTGEENEMPKLW